MMPRNLKGIMDYCQQILIPRRSPHADPSDTVLEICNMYYPTSELEKLTDQNKNSAALNIYHLSTYYDQHMAEYRKSNEVLPGFQSYQYESKVISDQSINSVDFNIKISCLVDHNRYHIVERSHAICPQTITGEYYLEHIVTLERYRLPIEMVDGLWVDNPREPDEVEKLMKRFGMEG